MPSAVPSGTFNNATKPTTRATVRAHSSRCNKPQPAKKPCRGFRQEQPSDDSEQGPQPDRDFGRWAAIGNVERVAEDRPARQRSGQLRQPRGSAEYAIQRMPTSRTCSRTRLRRSSMSPSTGLAAASATLLSRLQLRTTLIAKHLLLLPSCTRYCHCIVRMQALTSSETSSQFPVLSSNGYAGSGFTEN